MDDADQERVEDMAANGPQTLNILLIGKTGVGKSATGNSILGRDDEFEDDLGISMKRPCREVTGKRFNDNVCVIDTPGVSDSDNEDTLKTIGNYVSKSMCELHVICLVLSSAHRPMKEDISAISDLCSLFGPAMLEHLIVVVTREEDLRRRNNSAIGFLLEYTNAGATMLKDCVKDDRVVGLDNFHEDWREKQVHTLLQKTKEIVAKNKGALYSFRHLLENKKELARQQAEINRKEQELKDEKAHLQREARQAEIKEAARKVRLEGQEREPHQMMEEKASLQKHHKEESPRNQVIVPRLKKEFEAIERTIKDDKASGRNRQQHKDAKQTENLAVNLTKSEYKAVAAWNGDSKKAEMEGGKLEVDHCRSENRRTEDAEKDWKTKKLRPGTGELRDTEEQREARNAVRNGVEAKTARQNNFDKEEEKATATRERQKEDNRELAQKRTNRTETLPVTKEGGKHTGLQSNGASHRRLEPHEFEEHASEGAEQALMTRDRQAIFRDQDSLPTPSQEAGKVVPQNIRFKLASARGSSQERNKCTNSSHVNAADEGELFAAYLQCESDKNKAKKELLERQIECAELKKEYRKQKMKLAEMKLQYFANQADNDVESPHINKEIALLQKRKLELEILCLQRKLSDP